MPVETQNLAYIIAFAIVNDKQDLMNFLSENAVILNPNLTDEELTTVVINALNSSSKVQENFISWIAEKTNNGYANFGETLPTFSSSLNYNSTLLPITGTSATTTSTSSGFWSGFDAGAVTGILTSGLSLFGGLTQSKEQRKALEAQTK